MSNKTRNKKKRQHYVPRYLLRGFSTDGRRLSLFVLDSAQYIDGASLKKQCYIDYFYGRDGEIEEAFARQETETAAILHRLAGPNPDTVGDDELGRLRVHLLFERYRTLASAQLAANFLDASAKNILRTHPNRPVSDEDLDRIRISREGPQFDALDSAAKSLPLVLDLKVKVVRNNHREGFVLSDHSVVFCNQWANHHPRFSRYPASTGLESKGLQIFLPLTPDVAVALYDTATYEYGSPHRIVCFPGRKDIAKLNALQAINAARCIYFDPARTNQEHLHILKERRDAHPSVHEVTTERRRIEAPDGFQKWLVATILNEVRLGEKLSFIRVIDTRSYSDHRGPALPIRSAFLGELARLHALRYDGKLEPEDAEWLSTLKRFARRRPTNR